MATQDNNPHFAQRVKNIDPLLFANGEGLTITAVSSTIETLLGAALPADTGKVEIINDSGATVYVDSGVATAASGPIPDGNKWGMTGTKDEIDLVQFFAAVNTNVGLFVYTTR